ncbi:guanylate-binding protein 4-like [Oryza brachyantha]|uniref:GB1/RHD3-type G domain-containing protein n=1 Tax=Oryza brachyantha TaxID=4533 RepID=J3MJ13_ORYBR|nr:guanylate-binding protein 4-like [Oryza brachyantha]
MGWRNRAAVLWMLAVAVDVAVAAARDADQDELQRAFPIVEPDHGHTKLRLAKEGLEAIKRIKTPIAAVAVIGPYRSGKSFLLNQLLSLTCDKGFGVGHMRDTKTKGIWVWGTPIELDVDDSKVSVLYLDTEGFESIGKSNVYDDRIFALATVLSSILIYNLPETIREADISRLSFAVEIAEEFYGRVKGQDFAFEPAKLLWLIQRDFLQGKSVQQMVDEALQRVPNNNGDKYIDEVNRIRDSLAFMGDNSTAFSLPQPHLQRTKLCDMHDQELDPLYIERRDQLKHIVASMIKPKLVQGRTLNGQEFVSFLTQILEALNKGEIPSTGSLVEVFNKAILERCLKLYNERMERVGLPLSVDKLQLIHSLAEDEARKLFDKQHFGKHHTAQSILKLDEEMKKVFSNFGFANEYQSSKLCEARFSECEDKMEHLQSLKLPSMAKFNAGVLQCNQSFEIECVGPAKETYERRMSKMLARSRALFIKEYNNKLFNWLVTFSLVMIVIGRFVVKFFLLEVAAWVIFIFLETYTRLFWSSELLYYNPIWHMVVSSWETIVYNPLLDIDRWVIPIVVMLSFLAVYWRCLGVRKRIGRSLLPLYRGSYGNSSRPRTD